jgi:uncharacterized repeat protein (TIGR01451 family)
MGFIFTALAIVVQMFAVFAPAKTTLATSQNNLIYGASNKQAVIEAVKTGRDGYGRTDIREIFDYYGITLADVEASATALVKSRERSYITTGRGHSSGVDTAVQIPGTPTTIYERSLNVWDIVNYENCYKSITGTARGNGILKGKKFWILLGNCGTTTGGCGNITFEPLPKDPSPEIIKSVVGATTHKPGESFSYRINYRNKGQAALNNVIIKDSLASEFEYVSFTSNTPLTFTKNGQDLTWKSPVLQPAQTWQEIVLNLKTKSIADPRKQVCNTASMSGSNSGQVTTTNSSAERCITIDNLCPGTNLPIPNGDINKCYVICSDGSKVTYDNPNNCPKPIAICEILKISDKPSWDKRTYEIKVVLTRFAALTYGKLLIDDKEVKNFGELNKSSTLNYTYTYKNAGSYKVNFIAKAKDGTTYNSGPSCELIDTIVQPNAIISLQKKVKNITQKQEDANNKLARGGDELEYSLTVKNNGSIAAENYVIDSDNLNDVLEYADLTTYSEAIYDRINQRLTWASTTIPANGEVIKKFTIKIKSPVPSTPPALSDVTSYDYKIRNVFGNEVVVNINKPIAGSTYQSINTLPSTGPGISSLISALGLIVIGYFYARSRLLVKEIELIKQEVAGA